MIRLPQTISNCIRDNKIIPVSSDFHNCDESDEFWQIFNNLGMIVFVWLHDIVSLFVDQDKSESEENSVDIYRDTFASRNIHIVRGCYILIWNRAREQSKSTLVTKEI